MKEINISYHTLMWEIPYITILKMTADLPKSVKVKNKKNNPQKLTAQTAGDFMAYIDSLNQNKKQ